MKTISDRVKILISEQTIVEPADITETAILGTDLLMDEFDVMCLSIALEDEFDIETNSDDLQLLKTVQEVIDYVTEKVEAAI